MTRGNGQVVPLLLSALAVAVSAGCVDRGTEPYIRLAEPSPRLPVADQTAARLVSFWASWCQPCVRELPSLVALAEGSRGRLEVVLIVDDPAAPDLGRWVNGGAPLSLVSDENGTLAQSFRVSGFPVAFLAVNGTVVARFEGERAWDGPAMRALLARLLSGVAR